MLMRLLHGAARVLLRSTSGPADHFRDEILEACRWNAMMSPVYLVYLRTYPEVPANLPQSLSNFWMQLQIPHEDIRALLVLNMARIPPPRDGVASIVLDLDLFRTVDLPQSEDELWRYIEILRTRKNEIFEACITDATRELFQ
jgi:uncharacterized protein (TIGR04255 family)